MKRWIKAISLLLAISILMGMFAACGKSEPKKEGQILAVYNGTPVYESEVQDIINYQLVTRVNEQTTEEQMMIIMGEAIGTFVQYRILELAFNEKGIKIDEKLLKQRVEDQKKAINESFSGGYENWKSIYRLSDHFLEEDVRRSMLAEIYYAEVIGSIEVTEDEMKAFMKLHSADYYNPAGYSWSIVFREVKDITDEAECAAANEEAQAFIDKIASGETTLEEVGVDLLEKYTEKDGYTKAPIFNGKNFTDRQTIIYDIPSEEELALTLADIGEFYAQRDGKADITSKEYANFMNWIAETYEVELYYALQNTEVGSVYAKPLRTFAGYGILRLDAVTEVSAFDNYEDVKEELATKVLEEKFEKNFLDYLETLHHKYNVEYLYTSFK